MNLAPDLQVSAQIASHRETNISAPWSYDLGLVLKLGGGGEVRLGSSLDPPPQ